jgi:hypothetical protein
MTDTIEPLKENDAQEGVEIQSADSTGDTREDSRQDIFDEQFQALMDGFGEACEEQNIEVAIAIAKHPSKEEPIVFFRGHLVDAASLAAGVLRQIKQQVFEQLNTEAK